MFQVFFSSSDEGFSPQHCTFLLPVIVFCKANLYFACCPIIYNSTAAEPASFILFSGREQGRPSFCSSKLARIFRLLHMLRVSKPLLVCSEHHDVDSA